MIAVIVQGLFEKSDSIGYDAIYQYKVLKDLYGATRPVKVFAERFDQALYNDVPIDSIDVLFEMVDQQQDVLIVYHFCDGWPMVDELLVEKALPAVVRWHNNTPPWFFTEASRRSANRSTHGFDNIIKLSRNEKIVFWVNSEFTAEQLRVLTGISQRCHVVYPASRYVEAKSELSGTLRPFPARGEPIRLLFVGRVVAHKGHKNIIMLAGLLQRYCSREIVVEFPGREESSAWKFNAMLRDIATESQVTVNFLGEVAETELRALYEQCTVFVCLSEHEGFGLPPFEAMRCQLPVVAWANTALKELLRGHPLSFEAFDIKNFAAAIVALEDDALRSKVVSLQNELAQTYTSQVLRKQIACAVENGAADLPLSRSVPVAALDEADLVSLHRAVRALRDFPHQFSRHIEHDVVGNYVTAYDVKSYLALLEGGVQQAVSALLDKEAPSVATKEIHIEATEFSTHHGAFKEGAFEFVGPQHPDGQFIFGPYIKLPLGDFEVSLEVERFRDLSPDGLLLFDVYVDGKGVVARRSIFPSILRSPTVDLDFQNTSVTDVIEFRIGPSPNFEGSFRFTGARIRRLSTIELLPSGPPNIVPAKLPKRLGGGDDRQPHWLIRNLRSASRRALAKANTNEKAARDLFDMADRARDAGSWGEAAELYRRGLEMCPNVVRYIVQMAHAFKEAGQLAAAELAYLGALELDPFDRDLKLQLGHFYSFSGRKPLAERFYIEAVRGDKAALDAYEELLRMGIRQDIIHAAAQTS